MTNSMWKPLNTRESPEILLVLVTFIDILPKKLPEEMNRKGHRTKAARSEHQVTKL